MSYWNQLKNPNSHSIFERTEGRYHLRTNLCEEVFRLVNFCTETQYMLANHS
jgi:hypothetical protein